MTNPIPVDLSNEAHERLKAVADKVGRTEPEYVRWVLEQHLEDMEDISRAERVLERIHRGEEEVVSAEEFWRGLED